MATATQQARSARQRHPHAVDGAPSEFVVFESNAGEYRWEIVTEKGATLAQSVSYPSFDDARGAADRIREGAGAARLESRSADQRTPAGGRSLAAGR